MSSRSRLFVSSEMVPGYNAVTLRGYLGGDVTVKEADCRGEYGFLIETASCATVKQKVNALKAGRSRQEQGHSRPQVSRSYSQDVAETYSSPPSSHLYPQQASINSTAAYSGRHGAYDSPQRSNLSNYSVSPRTNEAHHAVGMESLSRQSSRHDTYEQYPASDRSAGGFSYASSGGSQPIAITQRRPSTISVRSDDSFDSTYGFKSSVNSPGSVDFLAGPRSGLQSSDSFYRRR